MTYSDIVLDHYNNPRNVGTLDSRSNTVGTALIGNNEWGEVVRLQIEVSLTTRVITAAKFKTFGGGAAIAASSLATEWLKGRTIEEAARIDNMDFVAALNLSPVNLHCSILVEDAIKAAINDFLRKNGLEELSVEVMEGADIEEEEDIFH